MHDLLEAPVIASQRAATDRERARIAELLQPKKALPAVDYGTAQPGDAFTAWRTQAWNPLSSRRIVATEGWIVAAVMAYFLGGVLAVFGGL